MPHRTGRGALRTPEEIRRDLTLPVYYILLGRAQPVFSNSSTPAPSYVVTIVRVRPDRDERNEVKFPVFVNYRQWNDIIVPILQDPRWSNFIGSLGGVTCTTEDGYPCGIPRQAPGAGVFSCNEGLRAHYIDLLGRELESRASTV